MGRVSIVPKMPVSFSFRSRHCYKRREPNYSDRQYLTGLDKRMPILAGFKGEFSQNLLHAKGLVEDLEWLQVHIGKENIEFLPMASLAEGKKENAHAWFAELKKFEAALAEQAIPVTETEATRKLTRDEKAQAHELFLLKYFYQLLIHQKAIVQEQIALSIANREPRSKVANYIQDNQYYQGLIKGIAENILKAAGENALAAINERFIKQYHPAYANLLLQTDKLIKEMENDGNTEFRKDFNIIKDTYDLDYRAKFSQLYLLNVAIHKQIKNDLSQQVNNFRKLKPITTNLRRLSRSMSTGSLPAFDLSNGTNITNVATSANAIMFDYLHRGWFSRGSSKKRMEQAQSIMNEVSKLASGELETLQFYKDLLTSKGEIEREHRNIFQRLFCKVRLLIKVETILAQIEQLAEVDPTLKESLAEAKQEHLAQRDRNDGPPQ